MHVVTDAVWKGELEPHDKIVALALARRVTHISGFQCEASLQQLSDRTGLPVADVEKALQRLQQQKVIDITFVAVNRPIYRFTMQYQGAR